MSNTVSNTTTSTSTSTIPFRCYYTKLGKRIYRLFKDEKSALEFSLTVEEPVLQSVELAVIGVEPANARFNARAGMVNKCKCGRSKNKAYEFCRYCQSLPFVK